MQRLRLSHLPGDTITQREMLTAKGQGTFPVLFLFTHYI